MEGLDLLYPPNDLEQRNAASRADGYWAYIREGKDVPLETTYGEFDIDFFQHILQRMMELHTTNNNDNGLVFCDIGSGAGRLVLAAAALFPDNLKLCRGIELLESIHKVAEGTLQKLEIKPDHDNNMAMASSTDISSQNKMSSVMTPTHQNSGGEESWVSKYEAQYRQMTASASPEPITLVPTPPPSSASTSSSSKYLLPPHSLPMAPMELLCGSFEDVFFGDANIIFVFSSCMSGAILSKLGQSVVQQCAPGTLLVTTEYSINDMPSQLELVETMDGTCHVVGGTSTAFFHVVK